MNQWVHEIFPFLFFPATLISAVARSGRGEEPSGERVLRLIQIHLATLSFEKICTPGKTNRPPRISPTPVPLKPYGLFNAVCGAGLITSSCALSFWRPAV